MQAGSALVFINYWKSGCRGRFLKCILILHRELYFSASRLQAIPLPARCANCSICVTNKKIRPETRSSYKPDFTVNLNVYRSGLLTSQKTKISDSYVRLQCHRVYSKMLSSFMRASAVAKASYNVSNNIVYGHQSYSQHYFPLSSNTTLRRCRGQQCRWSHSLRTKETFTLNNGDYNRYLKSLVEEYKNIADNHLKGHTIDHAHFLFLQSVVSAVEELERCYVELAELRLMISGETDVELQVMAKKDVDNTLQKIQELEDKLVDLLVGSEPADKNDIMLDVNSGVGGQEAMLFTAEIFDMYRGYANYKGWTFDVVEFDKSDIGGLRKASALISGMDVYKHLKFEAGVHRVQRVPRTEKSGRLHTSTMTVAVLPQPSQIDITVNPKDLHIDTFRAGGAGGQHVNKTESAVRITHKPTGTVAECQQERSQIRNRELAMKILLSRIYQKQLEEQEMVLRHKRKLQVGSAGRSEKIRTYNYSQDRITDHRGPTTLFNIGDFLSGKEAMNNLIFTLMNQSHMEVLQSMVDEFLERQLMKK